MVAKLVEEEDIWVNFFVNTIKHSGDSKYVLGRVKLGLRNILCVVTGCRQLVRIVIIKE